ncbi:hypothetical protein T492DRAFT_871915, partial [Pavlovales sp. CCMP2436]
MQHYISPTQLFYGLAALFYGLAAFSPTQQPFELSAVLSPLTLKTDMLAKQSAPALNVLSP